MSTIHIRTSHSARAVHLATRDDRTGAILLPFCGAPGNTPAAFSSFRPRETDDAVTCKRCAPHVAAYDALQSETAEDFYGSTDEPSADDVAIGQNSGPRGLTRAERADIEYRATARDLFYGAVHNGGASIWTGEEATHGYLVGIPDHGMALPSDRATAGIDDDAAVIMVAAWLATVDGTESAATIGSWRDDVTGRLYFDISSHHAELESAATVAANRAELAFWDVAAECEVRTFYACDYCRAEVPTVTVADSSGDPVRICSACR